MSDDNVSLLVDLYELTMLEAYRSEGMNEPAVFSLFVRRLPENRNFLLACGLDTVLAFLEELHFSPSVVERLVLEEGFDPDFGEWLSRLRFRGAVRAVPEGTPVFENEPLLEIEAPLPEAQLVETFVMNQIHLQTVLASKAARVKRAAEGRSVVDFGLRRMHGIDAGIKAVRAFAIAGIDATSNVLGGELYGVPRAGTMAHSYVQAHSSELEAFRAFVRVYPEGTLLVDTYDTLEGVRNVVRLAGEMGERFRVRGVRLDSGDLATLSRATRRILDQAGLDQVRIVASGGLDEWKIRILLKEGAPIDTFGVGTGMGVSEDAPSLDIAYKLTEYAGEGRLKLSPEKAIFPGAKQVFRVEQGSRAVRDVVGRADEEPPGRPLMMNVMNGGRRLPAGRVPVAESRERAREELARLPARILALDPAEPPYPVEMSRALVADRELLADRRGAEQV
jgi:nicotinate phosphoribosyltransferase